MCQIKNDNGPAFKATLTQGLSKALGIAFHLHCAWRPQSSGKVEKANDMIKRHLQKLSQETPFLDFLTSFSSSENKKYSRVTGT